MSSIAGNTSTSAILSAGETETHSITAAGDQDWFRVSLVAGRDYSFTVLSSGGPGIGLVGPDIALYDAFGTPLVSQSTYSNATTTITFRAVTSGTYFVGVGETTYGTSGQYAVTWNSADTIRADVATSRNLVADGTVSGNLEVSGDSDWFAFNMTSGLSYGFEVRGATTNQLVGGDLQLRDANGNVLASETTYSGTIYGIDHHPTVSGGYFLSVNDSSGDTGGYTVRWIASDTIQNNISTTQVLNRNASVSSRIDVEGDSDWFKVTMRAGETYGFQVLSATADPLQWGDLQLRDAQGNIIASFTSYSGSVNTLAYTAGTTGTYFVSVNDTSDDTGGYTLRNIGADSVRANITTSSRLVEGSSLAGRIEMLSDSDWHRFEAQQGQSYTFTLSGDGAANELNNTRLILRDAAGNNIREVTGSVTTITHIATTNGPLFVDVRGYDTTDWGGYVLTSVSDAPTITGTAAADRLQGGAGATVMNGNAGNDWLDGGLGNDRLFGSSGNDRLFGNADNDRLYGGTGDDRLFGGSGADTLEGEAGNDTLAGGSGSDQFLFRPTSNSDVITDFQDGADRIRIIGGPAGVGGLTFTTLGEDVRISFGTVRILVENITRAELSGADFLFS